MEELLDDGYAIPNEATRDAVACFLELRFPDYPRMGVGLFFRKDGSMEAIHQEQGSMDRTTWTFDPGGSMTVRTLS